MSLPLYSRLEACSQLKVTTICLCLIPLFPHDEFGHNTEDCIPYPYRVHPWVLIQYNEATLHQNMVCVPGGGLLLAIQSNIFVTTTLNSSDTHPKRRCQFIISINSASSALCGLRVLCQYPQNSSPNTCITG